MTRIADLLSQIRELNLRSEELSKLKGENFNIFKLLKLEGAETTLHSTFLAELMDPNGSHGYENLFLKAFIRRLNEELNLDLKEDFQLIGDWVKKEKYISPVNFQREEGGLLDIFIHTDQFVIGIENKIFSVDGYLQLERYRNYLNSIKKEQAPAVLLYLTLDGKLSTSDSLTFEDDYYCLSYEKFVLNWIEECHSISSDSPILRETLKQYIITIQYLTNQLTSQSMEKELEELLSKYYNEAQLVAANIGKVQDKRVVELYGFIKNELDKKLPTTWEMSFDLNGLNGMWNQISFRQNWVEGLNICLEGTSRFVNGFGHGILLTPEKFDKQKLKTELSDKISFSKRTNNWMTYKPGSYSQLAKKVNSSKNLEVLAGEISNYILQVIESEREACEIINDYLISLDTSLEAKIS